MKILVMRPSPEGEKLVNILNYIGIISWHFSLFNFLPSTSSMSLSKKIYELYVSDIVLAFSKRSIYYTNVYLNQHNLHWPLSPDYYAIGRGTGIYLNKYIKKKFFSQITKKIANLCYICYIKKMLENLE